MPRPPKKPTKQDQKKIEFFAGLGLTQKQIAVIQDINCDTLRKYSLDEFNRGKAKAIANVAQVAYKMAVSGDHPAMTRYYLGAHAGWSEGPAIPAYICKALGINLDEEDWS